MQSINWGIIGCGDVTEVKSGPAFNKVPNSKLIAVMRRNGAMAEDYARRHHVPNWYDDASKLIYDPAVNAIYIATPPSTHKQYCLQALTAGKCVYVEKPMALNAKEAREISNLVKNSNGNLSVAHYRRAQPKFIKIREMVHSGAIGELRYSRILFTRPALGTQALSIGRTAWRVNPAVSGGGLFHDLAPHQLDLALYLFGEVRFARGVSLNQGKAYEADDTVSGHLLFTSGTVCTGLWNFAAGTQESLDQFEIVGTRGRISFAVFDSQSVETEIDGKYESLSFPSLEHVQEPMINEVVKFFLGQGENPCKPEEGVTVMQVMDSFCNGLTMR